MACSDVATAYVTIVHVYRSEDSSTLFSEASQIGSGMEGVSLVLLCTTLHLAILYSTVHAII